MGRTRFLDDVAPAKNITDWCQPSRHPLSGFCISFPNHCWEMLREIERRELTERIMYGPRRVGTRAEPR